MQVRWILSGAVCLATLLPAMALAADEAPRGDASAILRLMPAVLDARNRHENWHDAAKAAADRIPLPALRQQFAHQLSALVPHVARELVRRPTEVAFVTAAVYHQQAGDDAKPVLVAVTFEGLSRSLRTDFLAAVAADFPDPPTANGLPAKLALDHDATSISPSR